MSAYHSISDPSGSIPPNQKLHNIGQSVNRNEKHKNRSVHLGGFRESGFQELAELNQVRYDSHLDPAAKKNMIQSIKKSFNMHGQQCSSPEVVLGLINCLNGPNHFLLGIQFALNGIITQLIINILLGLALGKTADLTQRHAKLSENDYLVTIRRILGSKWEKIYTIASMLSLWTVAIIFILTGCDATYSAIRLFSSKLPEETEIAFNSFSYQYIGLIFVIIEILLILPKRLTFIFRLTSYVTYFTFFGIVFVIIVGIYDLVHNPPSFTVSGDTTNTTLSLFGPLSFTNIIYSVGFFETTFQVHNEVVNLLRTSKDQSKNTQNLFISYRVLQVMYFVTGILGSFIVYSRRGAGQINTLLSLFTKNDPSWIFILAFINQILLGIQTLFLAAVIIFIFRSQFFTLIYSEINAPPEWAYHTFNVVILITIYITEVFNFNPSTAMSIAGAFFGLFIMYVVPILVHLKCLNLKTKKQASQPMLTRSEMDLSLASIITKHKSKLSVATINVFYILLIVQGVVTLIGVILYFILKPSS